jgi:hypothetical protein
MLRQRFFAVLLAAAAAACSDTPSMPENTVAPTPEAPTLQTVPGILVAENILRSGDRLIWLGGWQTHLFRKLIGAEVLIEGRMDADPESGIEITDFQLLALDGLPVVDGTLSAREEGYFIRARGGMFELPEVPEELAHYLGRRVYVAHSDGAVMRFGLLELEE